MKKSGGGRGKAQCSNAVVAERVLKLLSMLLDHVTALAPTATADKAEEGEAEGDDEGKRAAELDKERREMCSWILFGCKFVSSTLQVVVIPEDKVRTLLFALTQLEQDA